MQYLQLSTADTMTLVDYILCILFMYAFIVIEYGATQNFSYVKNALQAQLLETERTLSNQ
jgi:hypothetical protein